LDETWHLFDLNQIQGNQQVLLQARYQRGLSKALSCQFMGKLLVVITRPEHPRCALRAQPVKVIEQLTGELELLWGDEALPFKTSERHQHLSATRGLCRNGTRIPMPWWNPPRLISTSTSFIAMTVNTATATSVRRTRTVGGVIGIQALRQSQSSHWSLNCPFKPMPDGFELGHHRKVLPGGSHAVE
jgi:hypothetical protein